MSGHMEGYTHRGGCWEGRRQDRCGDTEVWRHCGVGAGAQTPPPPLTSRPACLGEPRRCLGKGQQAFEDAAVGDERIKREQEAKWRAAAAER